MKRSVVQRACLATIALGAALLTSTLGERDAAARVRNQCIETADVVGETRCRNFGGWWATERSVPMFMSFGAWSSFMRAPIKGTTRVAGAEIDGVQLSNGALRAHGGELRMGAHLSRYVYLGLGLGLALGSHEGTPIDVNGTSVSLDDGINAYHGFLGTFVGVRVPLGRVSLRLEIATALQMVGFSMKSTSPEGTARAGGGTVLGFGLDPRAMIDVWATPDTTFSLWTGTNLLRPGDFTAGLMVGGHLRAFDGADD